MIVFLDLEQTVIDDAVDHTLQFTLNDTNVMFINIEECPHG